MAEYFTGFQSETSRWTRLVFLGTKWISLFNKKLDLPRNNFHNAVRLLWTTTSACQWQKEAPLIFDGLSLVLYSRVVTATWGNLLDWFQNFVCESFTPKHE